MKIKNILSLLSLSFAIGILSSNSGCNTSENEDESLDLVSKSSCTFQDIEFLNRKHNAVKKIKEYIRIDADEYFTPLEITSIKHYLDVNGKAHFIVEVDLWPKGLHTQKYYNFYIFTCTGDLLYEDYGYKYSDQKYTKSQRREFFLYKYLGKYGQDNGDIEPHP